MKGNRKAGARVGKRILIIDDHPMMREGLAQLISNEGDLSVCGEAGDAAEGLAKIELTKPDLVIADITLPGKSGLELIKDVQALHPGISILIISMHDEAFYAERVLRAGGRGYIMKQEGGKKLMEAIRVVLEGRVYVSEKMSAKLLELFSHRRPVAGATSVQTLTDREFEIFQLLGKGLSTAEMAQQLRLSTKTVEVHRLNIKTKLKMKTASELLRYAVRWVESENPGQPQSAS